MAEQVDRAPGMPAPGVGGGQALPDPRMELGPAVLSDLFPEGPAFRASLRTYTVLLILSAFIATFGLYQDSVASIIGAMVVAPLGGAIMAVAGALVTGRIRWQPITLLQVAIGSLGVIGVGYAVSAVMPDLLVLTPSIEARTSPGLLDLGVALAAGAAGAYVTVRRTGTDALPGVAIAVSLVPPLATIGICLELGRIDDAGGATILFLTNVVAIVVAACVVFLVAGAAPAREQLRERRRLRNGFIVAMAGLVLISIPLVWTGIDKASALITADAAEPVVAAWLDGSDLTVTDYQVEGQAIDLRLTGPQQPPSTQALADSLAHTLGRAVDITVEWVPSQVDRASSAP